MKNLEVVSKDLQKIKVLISVPSPSKEEPYAPYIWGVLKSYWEDHTNFKSNVDWLPPIYKRASAKKLLKPYLKEIPDVLGLSCYVWNWDLNCKIAAYIKTKNPNCVVIAGGPHPDYKDKEFFKKHPYIDIVAVKDGEVTLSLIHI